MGRPEDEKIVYPPILETLGKDHEQNWRESAHTELKRVQDSFATRTTFGDIPAAQSFAAVYAAAQHTYAATLRGIQEDLEAAGAALAEAGRQIRARDENAGDSFRTLMTRWSTDDGFSATQRHDQASEDEQVQEGVAEKERLENGTGAGGDGTTAAGPSADGAPTTPTDGGSADYDTGGTPADG